MKYSPVSFTVVLELEDFLFIVPFRGVDELLLDSVPKLMDMCVASQIDQNTS